MKTVLIIGVGQFGSHIARRMEELRCEVMAVDENEERINEILPYVTNARIGDSTNEEFLRSLGVGNYDVCIVALGSLFQSSLETTSLLKELGAKKVISRATNDVQMKFLLKTEPMRLYILRCRWHFASLQNMLQTAFLILFIWITITRSMN